jgi:zinc transport system substrate-binding protein
VPSRALLALALLCAALAPGCAAARPEPDGRLRIVAGFYPLAFAAERVGGDRVSVTSLTQPGAEPHDLELTPRQVAAIADADLVVYLGGFQPAIDAAVAQEAADRSVDVGAGIPELPAEAAVELDAGELPERHDHADADPHVWLDPRNMVTIGATIRDRLAALAPDHAQVFGADARRFSRELTRLDRRWLRGTRVCGSRDLVVSHAAFAYLAARYRFRQVAILGLSPEAEPSPATIAEMADFVRRSGTRTVYYETLVDPKVAQTIAAEAGVGTGVLDPIEGVPEGSGDDYFSLMAANLAAVREGQPCR